VFWGVSTLQPLQLEQSVCLSQLLTPWLCRMNSPARQSRTRLRNLLKGKMDI